MSQTYTKENVAVNNGRNGRPVWMIIKGGVYDVTKFIDEHPGGGELLLECAGTDATKDFNEAGHSADALSNMKKYKIGTVIATPKQSCKESPTTANIQKEQEAMATSGNDKDCYRAQKKRIKLFFCF